MQQVTKSLVTARNAGISSETPRLSELGLWLTEQEAELLLALCLGSHTESGPAEEALFAKLGELLRSFRES